MLSLILPIPRGIPTSGYPSIRFEPCSTRVSASLGACSTPRQPSAFPHGLTGLRSLTLATTKASGSSSLTLVGETVLGLTASRSRLYTHGYNGVMVGTENGEPQNNRNGFGKEQLCEPIEEMAEVGLA